MPAAPWYLATTRRLTGTRPAALPEPEQQEALLEMVDRESLADPAQRMGQRARYPALVEQIDEIDDVRPGPIEITPQRLVDSPGQDVHGDTVVREERGGFQPDDHIGVVGDPQRSGNRVVIGQRDPVHAATFAGGVRLGRIDERFGHQRR